MGRSNMCNIHTAKETERTQEEITISGNPAKPQGEDGATMLKRMNESHSPVTCWALEHWQIAPEEELLDIGCGGGATLKRMGEKITTGHLTGVDYSPVSVKTSLKTNRQDVESGKMKVLEGSVEALPFADDGFDKIITVESFYFWPDPQENLKEVRRVLKAGGTFLLVADIYQNGNLTEREKENIRNYHLFNPTKEEFEQLFINAGFTDIQIHTRKGENWICVEGIPGGAYFFQFFIRKVAIIHWLDVFSTCKDNSVQLGYNLTQYFYIIRYRYHVRNSSREND